MQCEICGRDIIGKLHRVIVEGVKMITCVKCSVLGSETWHENYKKQNFQRNKLKSKIKHKRNIQILNPLSEKYELKSKYGHYVRQTREKLGLSLEDLGKSIGEKVSLLSKIETEKINPDHDLVRKLEHKLQIKLLIPVKGDDYSKQISPSKKGVTIGEIAQMKKGERRLKFYESDSS